MKIIKDLGHKGVCHTIANSAVDYFSNAQDAFVRHYATEEDYNAEAAERAEIAQAIKQAQQRYDEVKAKFEQGEATQEQVSQALYDLQMASGKTAKDRHILGLADDKYTFLLTEELDVTSALYALLEATPDFAPEAANA